MTRAVGAAPGLPARGLGDRGCDLVLAGDGRSGRLRPPGWPRGGGGPGGSAGAGAPRGRRRAFTAAGDCGPAGCAAPPGAPGMVAGTLGQATGSTGGPIVPGAADRLGDQRGQRRPPGDRRPGVRRRRRPSRGADRSGRCRAGPGAVRRAGPRGGACRGERPVVPEDPAGTDLRGQRGGSPRCRGRAPAGPERAPGTRPRSCASPGREGHQFGAGHRRGERGLVEEARGRCEIRG